MNDEVIRLNNSRLPESFDDDDDDFSIVDQVQLERARRGPRTLLEQVFELILVHCDIWKILPSILVSNAVSFSIMTLLICTLVNVNNNVGSDASSPSVVSSVGLWSFSQDVEFNATLTSTFLDPMNSCIYYQDETDAFRLEQELDSHFRTARAMGVLAVCIGSLTMSMLWLGVIRDYESTTNWRRWIGGCLISCCFLQGMTLMVLKSSVCQEHEHECAIGSGGKLTVVAACALYFCTGILMVKWPRSKVETNDNGRTTIWTQGEMMEEDEDDDERGLDEPQHGQSARITQRRGSSRERHRFQLQEQDQMEMSPLNTAETSRMIHQQSSSFRAMFEPFQDELVSVTSSQSQLQSNDYSPEPSLRDMLAIAPLEQESVNVDDSLGLEPSLQDLLSIEPLDNELSSVHTGSIKSTISIEAASPKNEAPSAGRIEKRQEPAAKTGNRAPHYSDAAMYGATPPTNPKSLRDLRSASALTPASPNDSLSSLKRTPLESQPTPSSWNQVKSGLTQEGLVTESNVTTTKRARAEAIIKRHAATKSDNKGKAQGPEQQRQVVEQPKSFPATSTTVKLSKLRQEQKKILDRFGS